MEREGDFQKTTWANSNEKTQGKEINNDDGIKETKVL